VGKGKRADVYLEVRKRLKRIQPLPVRFKLIEKIIKRGALKIKCQ
jgi:hypothetical protein